MKKDLKDLLEEKNMNLGQTIDLINILDDINEDLYSYSSRFNKAENKDKKQDLADSLAFEYGRCSSRIDTLIYLIHDNLSNVQKAINDGLEQSFYEDKSIKKID